MSTVVIDPGHGGTKKVGGSSSNNATSASGVLEKNICLDIANRIKRSLESGEGAKHATSKMIPLTVVLTRDKDENLGLSHRAQVANNHNAAVYLSIHCNGFDGKARGTEIWIDRKYMSAKKTHLAGKTRSMPGPGLKSSGVRNLNVAADEMFAKKVVDAAFNAFKEFDKSAKLRSTKYTKTHHGEVYKPEKGVKMMGLGTLRDSKLGTADNKCRAALLELEFIDHPKVDLLLNGGNAAMVRDKIAEKISLAIVDSL